MLTLRPILLLALTVQLLYAARIVYPGGSAPVIVQSGDTVALMVTSNLPVDSVWIKGEWISYKLPITKSVRGKYVYDPLTLDSVNGLVSVRIPSDVCSDLFSVAAYAGTDSAISVKALKTISGYPSQWSVVHITDPHVTAAWDTTSVYAKELEFLSPIVSVINVLAPDIVICTGDNVMDYLQNGAPPQGEKWNQFFNGYGNLKGVHGINSPVFVTTGNHDAQYPNGAASYSRQWTKWVGKRYYALSFGMARFLFWDNYLGLDDTSTQRRYFSSWLDSVGAGGIRISALHNPGSVQQPFHNEKKVSIALAGHTHRNAATSTGTTPTRVFETGSASHVSYVGASNIGWLRFLNFRDSVMTMNQFFQFGNTSTKEEALTVNFDLVNNGSVYQNRAVVRNKLGINLPPFAVRFVLKKGEYNVTGGTVKQVYSNDSVTVVDVRVPALKNDSAAVSVSPQTAAEKGQSLCESSNVKTYPNPFNPVVTIKLSENRQSSLLKILNISGEIVWNRVVAAGTNEIKWNGITLSGHNVPSGIYYAEITSGNNKEKRMLVLSR